MPKSALRIIAGKWRGRKVLFDDARGLRPTTDRIRETLFNWLMNDIHGADCLDAFAGSGVLGFEALSRGANSLIMLEENKKTIENLKTAAQTLSAEKLTINQQDATVYFKNKNQSFDVIFLDPPFSQNYLPELLKKIRHNQFLKPNGLLYVEYEQSLKLDFSHWKIIKNKSTATVNYSLVKEEV